MNILGYNISDDGCQSGTCHIKRRTGVGHCDPCSCFRNVGKADMIAVKKELYAIVRKDQVKDRYTSVIREARELGFTDDDWNDANNRADA